MLLTYLSLSHLRNLEKIEITPNPKLNYLIGANGSGKTSLLEALYLLGMGKSFRSSQLNRVIQHGSNELNLFAELTHEDNPDIISKIGFSRDLKGKVRMKINGEAITGMAELAQLLPILLLYTESYTLFRDSPKTRRKWLDWGMFHVEHLFYPLWKKLQKILLQRNVLLKQQAPTADITAWDFQLIEISQSIHQLRVHFIKQWQECMRPILQALFDRDDLLLTYTPGWDTDLGLEKILQNNLAKDRALGYTTRGPQRADIQIYLNEQPVQHVMSLGQQKLLVSGIILSQALLLKQFANKTPLLLIDDLPAELDESARQRIAAIIHQLDAQIFLTAIDESTLAPFLASTQPISQFLVNKGKITQNGV